MTISTMEKTAEVTWPENFAELKRIEKSLLCGICYEYLKISVITPCSHNYCSICIRKFLQYKQQCPTCFEQTYDKDLRVNRTLDEIVENFLKVRDKLGTCMQNAKVTSESEKSEPTTPSTMDPPTRPARNSQTMKTPKKLPPEPTLSFPNSSTSPIVPKFTQKLSTNSPGTSRNIMSFFKTVQSNANKLPCPVCHVEVSEMLMNKHLDSCLKIDSEDTAKPKESKKRTTLPKLVLRVMKDAELKKRLKDYGLSSVGSRKTLEARFRRYTLMYNAECDKPKPRSIQEIIRLCENEEAEEKRMGTEAKACAKLQVSRNCSETVINEAHKQYRETNKNSFENLINSIKQRENAMSDKASSSSSSSTKTRKEEMSPMKGKKEEAVTDSDDAYSFSADNDAFHDSDSSNPYPLQRYVSNDPMQFLNVQFSDSDTSNSPVKTKTIPSKNSPNILEESILDVSITSISNSPKERPSTPAKLDSLQTNDVFNASTDSDTTDPEGDFGTPQRGSKRVSKRLKLSQQSTGGLCLSPESQVSSSSHVKTIADSIIEDFLTDSLSNDVFCDEAKTAETPVSVTESPAKLTQPELMESAKAKSPVIHRPLRKLSRSTRSSSEAQVSVAEPEKTKNVLHETGNAGVEESAQSDGTLKRRRGKPRSAPKTNIEIENLPKRPLRRRITKEQRNVETSIKSK